ncbi:hypothetical protein F5X68DRAFT_208341 [Plectosphaerella plurivora]|uniref:Uncharacterized protein n=1 Tax=Plectosphaerella plurivora TaxID=936078 RepID=A0A9P8VAH2_9PEZI|nr:hypothetical protein F5X68DRAFT_208341 [Plectosphaerella plurivora]
MTNERTWDCSDKALSHRLDELLRQQCTEKHSIQTLQQSLTSTMSSPAGQLREQAASGPRGSPPRLVHPQRPRLRACVTAPSITTSNACREALTSPQSAEKATDLLNRVAVFTSPSVEFPTVRSLPSQIEAPPGSLPSLETASDQDMGDVQQSYPGCYFSFPGFDTWECEEQAGKGDQGFG